MNLLVEPAYTESGVCCCYLAIPGMCSSSRSFYENGTYAPEAVKFNAQARRIVQDSLHEAEEMLTPVSGICCFKNYTTVDKNIALLNERYVPKMNTQLQPFGVYMEAMVHIDRADKLGNVNPRKWELLRIKRLE